jgi:hypothetical protein
VRTLLDENRGYRAATCTSVHTLPRIDQGLMDRSPLRLSLLGSRHRLRAPNVRRSPDSVPGSGTFWLSSLPKIRPIPNRFATEYGQQCPLRCIDSQVWSASCQSVCPVYAAVYTPGGCRRRRRASLVFPRQNSFLVCFRCGSLIWPKKQFNVAWPIRRDNGQPFELPCWYVRFLHEAQGIRIELEGFVLIVHKHARQFDGPGLVRNSTRS